MTKLIFINTIESRYSDLPVNNELMLNMIKLSNKPIEGYLIVRKRYSCFPTEAEIVIESEYKAIVNKYCVDYGMIVFTDLRSCTAFYRNHIMYHSYIENTDMLRLTDADKRIVEFNKVFLVKVYPQDVLVFISSINLSNYFSFCKHGSALYSNYATLIDPTPIELFPMGSPIMNQSDEYVI